MSRNFIFLAGLTFLCANFSLAGDFDDHEMTLEELNEEFQICKNKLNPNMSQTELEEAEDDIMNLAIHGHPEAFTWCTKYQKNFVRQVEFFVCYLSGDLNERAFNLALGFLKTNFENPEFWTEFNDILLKLLHEREYVAANLQRLRRGLTLS